MKILITSGGTKIPIDPVRNIANASTGAFGAAIATAALMANAEVIYLASEGAKSPFSMTADFTHESLEVITKKLGTVHALAKQYHTQYHEVRYVTYDDYAEQLHFLIEHEEPDVVILVAAVSDYLVEQYTNDKIRSGTDLHLNLVPAPKLIHQIKSWLPRVFLVGFKLLINATNEELLSAAQESIKKNKADLIVANDLSSTQRGEHTILIVEPDGSYQTVKEHLAEKLIQRILRGKNV